MKKKNLLVRVLVPVVLAGLVFVGFSACSQDDGYPEGFVLNDEKGAATLAKRSMPQGGEAVTPPKPPKEEDDEPKRILAGSSDFDVVIFADIPLIDNMGNVHYENRPVGVMGEVYVYWVEAGKGFPKPHYDVEIVFDDDELSTDDVYHSSVNDRGIMDGFFTVYGQQVGANVEIIPEYQIKS